MATDTIADKPEQRGSRLAAAALQLTVGLFTPLALVSIGGLGIYAAPLLLPLLWVSSNACRSGGRWYFIALASLLAAESTWAISWTLLPALQLLLPLTAAATTAVLFIKTWHRALPRARTALVLVALAALGFGGIAALAADGEARSTRETTFDRSR